jgi:hypothetical protein
MSKLRDIAIKLLKGELPALADGELAEERMKVCRECDHFRKMIINCEICGCFLPGKTKLLEMRCPIDKW